MITDYQKQAADFIERFGLSFRAEFVGKNCPLWSDGAGEKRKNACKKCGQFHGWEYLITIKREPRDSGHGYKIGGAILTFPLWNSWADTHFSPKVLADPTGDRPLRTDRDYRFIDADGYRRHANRRPASDDYAKEPTEYDALACISSDVHCETDFAAWCAEMGMDTDSKRAEAMHKRCVEFALKLRQFFTEEEIEALSEIN